MRMEQEHRAEWPQALRRYLGVSIVANLVWEMLQLPLYTVWATGTRKQQAFAVARQRAQFTWALNLYNLKKEDPDESEVRSCKRLRGPDK